MSKETVIEIIINIIVIAIIATVCIDYYNASKKKAGNQSSLQKHNYKLEEKV